MSDEILLVRRSSPVFSKIAKRWASRMKAAYGIEIVPYFDAGRKTYLYNTKLVEELDGFVSYLLHTVNSSFTMTTIEEAWSRLGEQIYSIRRMIVE